MDSRTIAIGSSPASVWADEDTLEVPLARLSRILTMNAVPDREVAAQLAAFRRESVDLERRLRGDQLSAADSEDYWRSQIGLWRGLIERTLANYPIQLRAISQIPSGGEGGSWEEAALEEIIEVRAKLDATIERLS
jgi:hypothetical protein